MSDDDTRSDLYDREIRQKAQGWTVVEWIDCDPYFDGSPNRATADRIVKNWYPTREQAEREHS